MTVEYSAELTDTFGGEANYSWVRRIAGKAKSELSVVRAVKREFGLAGVRCVRSDYGDMIELKPSGACVVVFIDFCAESSSHV